MAVGVTSDVGEPPVICIAPDFDLVVKAYGHSKNEDDFYYSATGEKLKGILLGTFQIRKAELSKVGLDEFKEVIRTKTRKLPHDTHELVDLAVPSFVALEIWLRVLHNQPVRQMYDVDITTVWHTIRIAKTHHLKIEALNGWFAQWLVTCGGDLEKLPNFTKANDLCALIFPCHHFEHEKGLATVTRRVVYENVGHIKEINPSGDHGLHVRPVIITALNNARGNLRGQIETKICKVLQIFARRTCECKKEALFAFVTALDNTGVFPVFDATNGDKGYGLNVVLSRMENLTYTAPPGSCDRCSGGLVQEFSGAMPKIQGQFDGICYNCLDEPNDRNWQKDFMNHALRGVPWSVWCHMQHGRPTWWYSWQCRKIMESAYERARQWRL